MTMHGNVFCYTLLFWLIDINFAENGEYNLYQTTPSCPEMLPPDNGFMNVINEHVITYTCISGYHTGGVSTKKCINGSWVPPEPPICLPHPPLAPQKCYAPPVVLNGRIQYKLEGFRAQVKCMEGFSSQHTFQTEFDIVCAHSGLWTTLSGDPNIICTKKNCPSPPELPWAMFKYVPYKKLPQPVGMGTLEGLQVEYTCSNGYTLLDPANARLICRNGQWEGPVPTCVLRSTCETPVSVRNGQWSVKSKPSPSVSHLTFEVGAEIEYGCHSGFKLNGPRLLQCEPSRLWSSQPPDCIPEGEATWYCNKLPRIENGYCRCAGVKGSGDLSSCMPFRRSAQVQCACLQGYTLQGDSLVTCFHSSTRINIGAWSKMPKCVKRFDGSGGLMDIPPYENSHGRPYNSADITDGKNKVSSLVIVVTTACSVLGVLLLIMAVMVFRRRKPHLRGMGGVGAGGASHLFQQGPTPPPYARVHNTSMDEHDRLALMAYAEASRVHLPSYEEAMRVGNSSSSPSGTAVGGGACVGGTAGAIPTVDYCSAGSGNNLPHNHQYHHQQQQQQQHSHYNQPSARIVGNNSNNNNNNTLGLNDGNNNINNNNNNNSANTNRHSIVTTSSSGGVLGNNPTGMYRDGISVSEMFGSLDTVNVSMSDASTSVTVETYDSGTSCGRSLGSTSQQATAGSLTSSHDQLADDDAPLLDSSSQHETDVVSVSSNPSHTSKDDQ